MKAAMLALSLFLAGCATVPANRDRVSVLAIDEQQRAMVAAAAFGAKPLQRRYTNVYVWQRGRWLWLARQANVTAGR